jgi:hypothetical protein
VAAWTTAVKNWFWGLLVQRKSPKVSVLEDESSNSRQDSTNFLEKVIFQTLDQPINGPPHLLSPTVELPDHMQEVAGQNPHLEMNPVPEEIVAP